MYDTVKGSDWLGIYLELRINNKCCHAMLMSTLSLETTLIRNACGFLLCQYKASNKICIYNAYVCAYVVYIS